MQICTDLLAPFEFDYRKILFHLNWIMRKRSLATGQLSCSPEPIQWNLYNETREVLLKTQKFCNLSGTVFIKSCLFSLLWKTTSLERPWNLVVSLYRFHCTGLLSFWPQGTTFSEIWIKTQKMFLWRKCINGGQFIKLQCLNFMLNKMTISL